MAVPSITTKLPTIPSEDFTKEKVLGQGGFGKVYFGKWQAAPVAVKELLVQTISDAFLKIFRSEAEIMANCQHPNTVRLFGICIEEGKLALLMEYLDKGSLYGMLQNAKIALSWPLRFSIAADIGRGLAYLHSQKIIHRDLKSLNILIAKDDTAKITDFGLAKIRLETSSKMTANQITGSPRWMAPEQFTQAAASEKTDIYSFGMILWEMAARKIPYSHAINEYIVIAAKMSNTHETIPAETPEEYKIFIQKCWKPPLERPTAKTLAQELDRLQQENPTTPPQLVSEKTPDYHSNVVTENLPKYPSKTLIQPPKQIAIPQKPLPAAIPSIAFGKAEWAKYFGDIGIEPPLPPNIEAILQSPCPFWPGKKVQETHLLILVPQTVNGKPLTLKSLGELVQNPQQGPKTQYRTFYPGEYNADTPAEPSHWVLMTRDVIPNSRNKSYTDQQKLAREAPSYQVPKIVEAATCIFMEYMRTNNRLYSDNPWTFTRCQEKYNMDWQLVVGGFSAAGLFVHHSYVSDSVGVAGLRKF